MAGYGYSYVSEKGFIAFIRDLNEGAWKDVAIKKYDAADQKPTHSLLTAERPVVWKLRATWGLRALTEILGAASAEVLAALDADWDSTQRKLFFDISSAAEDRDPAKREASIRLRAALLAGNGTAQTAYSYDDEVDFGRQQLELTRKAPLSADVTLLGLEALLKQIDETTEALAKGLGRGPGQKRLPARSARLRDAISTCSATFNAIHDEMAWTLEHSPAGPVRAFIESLMTPFEALLGRFPAPSSAAKTDGEPAAPPGNAAPKGTP